MLFPTLQIQYKTKSNICIKLAKTPGWSKLHIQYKTVKYRHNIAYTPVWSTFQIHYKNVKYMQKISKSTKLDYNSRYITRQSNIYRNIAKTTGWSTLQIHYKTVKYIQKHSKNTTCYQQVQLDVIEELASHVVSFNHSIYMQYLSTFVFCPFLLTIIVSVCSQITLFVIFKLVLNGWCGVSLNLSTVREN